MPKVIVYTSNKFPNECKAILGWLVQHKVSYTEFDASSNVGLQEEAQRKSGSIALPVIDVDGTTIVGADLAQLEKVLNLPPEIEEHAL